MLTLSVVLGCALLSQVGEERRAPAVEVLLVRPDEQLAEVIRLFEGSGVAHPAELLANWRRATGNPDVLDKVAQALVASLNPEMVREWSLMNGARVCFDPGPDGAMRWFIAVPRDDGTFGGVATAMSLTDGGAEEPLAGNGARVDRIGRGGPWIAQRGPEVVMGSARSELARGFESLKSVWLGREAEREDSGVYGHMDAEAAARFAGAYAKPLLRLTSALGLKRIDARLALSGGALRLSFGGAENGARAAVDREWLDVVPNDASFAGAIALNRDGAASRLMAEGIEAFDFVFERLGAGERLGRVAGVFVDAPEVLRGVAGFVRCDDDGEPCEALLSLNAADATGAVTVRREVAPRVLKALGVRFPEDSFEGDPGQGVVELGSARGKPLRLAQRGASVLLGWGDDAVAAALAAFDDADRSARRAIEGALKGDSEAWLIAAMWPDRLAIPGLERETPLGRALRGSDPICLELHGDGSGRLVWAGARGFVERLTKVLPQAPAPGR